MDYSGKRIRIKDIAVLAGVSAGTVDRVLHNRGEVSERSREKVEKVLQEMQFRPNFHAAALANKRSYRLSCLIPEYIDGEYWEAVERGIRLASDEFRDLNISISVLFFDQFDPESYRDGLNRLSVTLSDGWMIAPAYEKETLEWAGEGHIHAPFVFIDSQVPGLSPLSFFGPQSFVSGQMAARLLFPEYCPPSPVVMFQTLRPGQMAGQQVVQRKRGFETYMRTHFPDLPLFTLEFDPDSALLAQQKVRRFLHLYPEIETGVIFNSRAYLLTPLLADRPNFNLLGYDLLPRNVEALKSGSIRFLLSQRPHKQGYLAIKALVDYILFKKEILPEQYMPIDILQTDNINYFLEHEQ